MKLLVAEESSIQMCFPDSSSKAISCVSISPRCVVFFPFSELPVLSFGAIRNNSSLKEGSCVGMFVSNFGKFQRKCIVYKGRCHSDAVSKVCACAIPAKQNIRNWNSFDHNAFAPANVLFCYRREDTGHSIWIFGEIFLIYL